tara:strand:+ start:1164 stop:2981 length:1818 start_codon:yes stop_codon:yes gene_type:complete
MTRSRKLIFYSILIILPLLILASIEMGLRMAGYGETYPLFIEAKAHEGYKQPNPDVVKRFFSSPDLAPNVSPDTVFFRDRKGDDTFRIMIQGGSTTAGFPYGRWASLTGMLEQRFKRLYPDKQIDIINTAMAAVNSYTLLDFVDEIIAEKPDLVLIYAGHNEYLGVMGVGSAFAAKGGRGATLLYLKLKNLRIYRLVESVYVSLMTPDKQDGSAEDGRTLMSKVAREKSIPFDSELYHAGIAQFSGNLELILSKYQAAGIPVMIGTLASNEKDQIPFSEVAEKDALFPDIGVKKPAALIAEYHSKLEQTPHDAGYAYTLGYLYEQQGQYEQALTYYTQAKDFDLLRFRAPEAFNQVIRSAAETFGAVVVDSQQLIRKDTDHGIIGNQHMLEHLHPNVRGYFKLGEAFGEAIRQHNYLGNEQPVIPSAFWTDQPVVNVDKLYGEFKVAQLMADYPFTTERQTVTIPHGSESETKALYKRINGANWLSVQKEMLAEYQKEKKFDLAAKTAALISDAFPFDAQTAYISGQLYAKSNDYALASYYLARAVSIDQQNTNYMLTAAHYLFLNRKFDQSLELLETAKSKDPQNERIDMFISRVEDMKKRLNH